MEEALKMREEVKDDFMGWRKICEETEVILEATRIQEEARTSGFRQDAEMWDETRRKMQQSVTRWEICPEATAPSANTS